MSNQASYSQMKDCVQDFVRINPLVYWFDFSISSLIAWGSFFLALHFTLGSLLGWFLLILSAICFYRSSAFTHELVHLREKALPGFYTVWHLVCGIPLLAPHFLYKAVHLAHHSKKDYGKNSDGEYINFGTNSRTLILKHFLFNLLIPLILIVRFMLIAPISILHPKFRTFVMKNLSFMGLKFTFARKMPSKKSDIVSWYAEEMSCCLLLWALFALFITNIVSPSIFYQWYAILITVLTLNSLRVVGATHWYTSVGGDMGMQEQVKDSINIKSASLFTHIICPTGTQFHALHHMFPSIPYHNLRGAYVRLAETFPEDKSLKETTKHSLFETWQMSLLRPNGKHKEVIAEGI